MKWTFWHSTALLFLLALLIAAGLLLPPQSGVWIWVAIFLVIFVSVLVIGHGITGYWKGVLIDEDNRVSLSRFQMACWTIVVLSTFMTAAFINIANNACGPGGVLAIRVPEALWILMGISTTSLVGSPLLKSSKKDKAFSTDRFLHTLTFSSLRAKGFDDSRVGNVGFIVVNKSSRDANFADMFRGEEVSNAANLDLSKIQMFYFTIIILVAYVGCVVTTFSHSALCIDKLPGLSESMMALLGISHAGFLTSKAVPRPPADNKII